MSDVWFSADIHLNESDERFPYLNRPFKNNEEMKAHLDSTFSVVKPEDTLYILGDVSYLKAPEGIHFLSKINGRKILIRGNHDRNLTDELASLYFDEIVPEGEGMYFVDKEENEKYFLTHYPTSAKKDCFNLVGHIHSAWKVQLNMINVGVDVNHMRPFSMQDIRTQRFLIDTYYDEDVWVAYKESNMSFINKRGRGGSYSYELSRRPD